MDNSDTSNLSSTTNHIELNKNNEPLQNIAVENITFDDILAERKQSLEEAKFRLDQRKAIHDMQMEKQREDFAEKQANVNIPDQHWLKTYWRPAVSWVYIVICAFDFLLFPMIQIMLPVIYRAFGITLVYTPWVPITLSQGGFFHIAMGSVIGVNSWSRGQEIMQNNAKS